MPPTLPPTAERALTQTLYATINHNLPVLVYVGGVALMILLLLYRPNRKLILFLVGFALLAFNFEYVKHIADPLLEQTQTSMESTGYQSVKSRRLMDVFFDDFIPFATYVGGWGLVFLGIILNSVKIPIKRVRGVLTHDVEKYDRE